MKAILNLHYFPCIEYFTILEKCEEVIIEVKENFQKQSYRNRCYILDANKIDRLTVPVLSANKGLPLEAMQIDSNHQWQKRHWRALLSAYSKAPFFEYYSVYFENLFQTDYQFLIDINKDILALCCKLLGLKTRITYTDNYVGDYGNDIMDLRTEITPKKNHQILNNQSYIQVFDRPFESNLSILDLLFCEGPNAVNILKSQNSNLLS